MAQLSVREFAKLVVKSKLVTLDQMKQAIDLWQKQTQARSKDWRPLGKILIDQGLLTSWQCGNLAKGRHKGFFLGKYKILSLLGAGGMATVYQAEHTVMLRRVALKILPQDMVADEEALDKFYNEGQAAAALDHANVVRAYDVDNEGKIHYLVMEFVDGPDLEKLVEKDGPVPIEDAADYVRQAAEGLQHAHSKGIVHRDIKPSNLLITTDGIVKILDMGLASFSTKATPSGKNSVAGTADYMAPEVARGSEATAASDLYSLGCTLYYLLTGQVPFPGSDMMAVLIKHQTQEPEAIEDLRPEVPHELAEIARRLMAKDPAQRYADAGESAVALSEWLTSHQGWSGDPGSTAIRPAEEVAAIRDFLSQVQIDHDEKQQSPEHGGSDELAAFFETSRSDAERSFDPSSDPQMERFLSAMTPKDDSQAGAATQGASGSGVPPRKGERASGPGSAIGPDTPPPAKAAPPKKGVARGGAPKPGSPKPGSPKAPSPGGNNGKAHDETSAFLDAMGSENSDEIAPNDDDGLNDFLKKFREKED